MATTVQVAAQETDQATAVAPRERARHGVAGRARRWWRRWVAPEPLRLGDVAAVLETARATVEAGWVQNRWYALAPRSRNRRPSVLRTTVVGPEEVTGACVVGALVLALREHHPHADLLTSGGRALDVVWEAVRDGGGAAEPATARRAWPRDTRLLRVRDLTRWNDHAGRTRAEVLAALDDASSRVIMAAVREPAPTR